MAHTSHKKVAAALLFVGGLLVSLSVLLQAEAAAEDSSISFKKDPGSGYFSLTVRDPDGIQEFTLQPVDRSSYGGGLSNCPKTFTSNNVTYFSDPSDFNPPLAATVRDCNNNTTELEIAPPKDGRAVSTILKKEAPPPPPPPAPRAEPKAEKKEGPLSAADIHYPVAALGGCESEAECRSYCDNVDRAKECLAFAKEYHLISEKEFREASDQFLALKNGPGGCNSWASCEAYCSTIDHIDECVAFAEKVGYHSADELAEFKKFQEIAKSGKQFPGGCRDRNSCEIYCNDVTHMEECLNFAEEVGFMPKEEIAEARKILPLMQRGETPGGCTSKEQCETYCLLDEHLDECIAFAEKAGLLSDEERALIRKTGGHGPGGCRSKEQCETYCADHSEECFRFAEEHDLISEKDLEMMREGTKRFREELDGMPPEVVECLKNAVGEDNFNRLAAGEPVFDRAIEGKMKSCFSELTSQLGAQLNILPPEAAECIKNTVGEEGLQKLKSGSLDGGVDFHSLEGCFTQLQASFGGAGGFGGPATGAGGFQGPGGCTTLEECQTYCTAHSEECQQFAPPGGGGGTGGVTGGSTSRGFSGPGGCTSVEECTAYCATHWEDQACEAYRGDGGDHGDGGDFALSCVEPPSGLVSLWSGEAVSGAAVSDSADGNNGSIVGGVSVVSGKVGNAFQFDGSSGYIGMGNPANLNFGTGPLSLEAWFYWNGGASVNNIIRKSNYPSSGPGAGYWLRAGNGTLEFSSGATTVPEGQSIITAPISTGVWHHAVGTKDASGSITLYVDGQSAGTVLRQAASAETTSEAPFFIGAWDGFGVSEFYSGIIDEVSVYNRALTADEAQALFSAGSAGKGKCAVKLSPIPPTYEGSTEYQQYQQPPPSQYPQVPSGYDIPVTPEICANFSSVPACSYVGSPDSQNYQLCKKCYPDR
jgi:hypothetical protein